MEVRIKVPPSGVVSLWRELAVSCSYVLSGIEICP
jgi:hypothetical protein